jgi:hypothetical protein
VREVCTLVHRVRVVWRKKAPRADWLTSKMLVMLESLEMFTVDCLRREAHAPRRPLDNLLLDEAFP